MGRRVGRDLRELLISGGMGLAASLLLPLTPVALVLCLVGGLGLPVLVEVVGVTRRMAGARRRRSTPAIASAYAPLPAGVLGRVRTILTDPATWRDLAWLAVQVPAGILAIVLAGLWLTGAQGILMPLIYALVPRDTRFDYQGIPITDWKTAFLVIPIGVLAVLAAYWGPRAYFAGEGRLARRLLAPTTAARLAAQVEHLAQTRAAAVDASAVELRRIERDLHDGAQARLVALTMNLGMAQDMFDTDPDAAKALLADARAGARQATSELRDLVRGIHPPLLADRGLPGALQALALASSIPVDLDVRLDRRLAAPVESAAYFTVAEALANAIKHSGASRIAVSVVDDEGSLRLRVHDDGSGGADPAGGTGLRGIQRRLAPFDGTVRVTSPAGGPTLVEAELPCAS
ncbi:sensor histidine kinase [Phytohabitans rumicis]|uniref:histidine kinase n=1 Tax=Phytohabitans rumicis TaxID=1076125 RepID=A0A6V8LGE5_9ACTN|nr:sensor histidine kinase [Phytohabitans rumicis]GFJ96332.1 histidine kinase [Phytohabitans rumicis]